MILSIVLLLILPPTLALLCFAATEYDIPDNNLWLPDDSTIHGLVSYLSEKKGSIEIENLLKRSRTVFKLIDKYRSTEELYKKFDNSLVYTIFIPIMSCIWCVYAAGSPILRIAFCVIHLTSFIITYMVVSKFTPKFLKKPTKLDGNNEFYEQYLKFLDNRSETRANSVMDTFELFYFRSPIEVRILIMDQKMKQMKFARITIFVMLFVLLLIERVLSM